MARPKVEKAEIFRIDNPGQRVVCHFNPKEFEVVKAVKWEENPKVGGDASELRFGGGKPQDFTIPLLFDSTGTGNDVRKAYEALFAMSLIEQARKDPKTNMGEPPKCRFQWGKLLSVTVVIESIKQKFLLFSHDGTPLRAEVTITMKEVYEKTEGQNPTSRSQARKTWIVSEGETLDWIAYREYGDSSQWRYIADTNDLLNPQHLQPGQILQLVPLP